MKWTCQLTSAIESITLKSLLAVACILWADVEAACLLVTLVPHAEIRVFYASSVGETEGSENIGKILKLV